MPRLKVEENNGPEVSVTLDIYKHPVKGISAGSRNLLESIVRRRHTAVVSTFLWLVREEAMHQLPMNGQPLPPGVYISLRGPLDSMNKRSALKQVPRAPHRHSWQHIANSLLAWVCLRTDRTRLRLLLQRKQESRSDVFYITIHLDRRAARCRRNRHEDEPTYE